MKKILFSILAVCLVLAGSVFAATADVTNVVYTNQNVFPGETVSGTFVVTNDNGAIDNVAVSATAFIKGVDSITGMGLSPAAIGTMASGASQTVTFTLGVPNNAVAGLYTGKANVTYTYGSFPPSSTTEDLTFTVKERMAVSLPTSVTIEGAEKRTIETTFTITNTGNADLAGLSLTPPNAANFTDDSSTPHTIVIDITNMPTFLARTVSQTVTVKITIPEDMEEDSYTDVITISGVGLTPQTVPLTVLVMSDLCEVGNIGDLTLDISEPSSSDSFNVGEEVHVEVNVENGMDDDVKIYVESWIYDLDKGRKVASYRSERTEISEDGNEDFTFDLVPDPIKIDEDNDYRLYVKAYKSGSEDTQCEYLTKDISFDREENDVRVMSATITPSSLSCGDNVAVTLTIQNVGTEDDDTIYVQLVENTLLGNAGLVSEKFSLNDGKSTTKTFDFKVPVGVTPKDYFLQANVQYDEGRGHSGFMLKTPLKVATCTIVPQVVEDVTVTLVQDKIESLVDQTVSIPFTITNNEKDDNKYTVEVSAVDDWAEQAVSTATVKAGQTSTEYAYLTPKKGTIAGAYKATITVKNSDGEVLTTKAVDVQLNSSNKITGWFSGTGTIGSFFRNMFSGGAASTTMWIIIDIVIIVLAIWLLKLIFAKK